MNVLRHQGRRVNALEPNRHALAHVLKAGAALHRTGLQGHGRLPEIHPPP